MVASAVEDGPGGFSGACMNVTKFYDILVSMGILRAQFSRAETLIIRRFIDTHFYNRVKYIKYTDI